MVTNTIVPSVVNYSVFFKCNRPIFPSREGRWDSDITKGCLKLKQILPADSPKMTASRFVPHHAQRKESNLQNLNYEVQTNTA